VSQLIFQQNKIFTIFLDLDEGLVLEMGKNHTVFFYSIAEIKKGEYLYKKTPVLVVFT
tara:strand:- start:3441 stop:3614 length:174 start_codon:yes stop_codon:yes gene_type:complete